MKLLLLLNYFIKITKLIKDLYYFQFANFIIKTTFVDSFVVNVNFNNFV